MSKLSQLREQRDAKAREASELNAKYAADQRMPKTDADKLDSVLAEVENIDGEIMRANRVAQLAQSDDPQDQHEAALNAATLTPGKHIKGESEAIRAFLRGGILALTPEQNKIMTQRVNPDIRAAMSTTTAAEGGFTTALEYQKSLELAMKQYGGIRQVATTIQTSTGMDETVGANYAWRGGFAAVSSLSFHAQAVSYIERAHVDCGSREGKASCGIGRDQGCAAD